MTGAVKVIPLSVITGAGLPMIIVPVSPVRSVAVKPVGIPPASSPLNCRPAIFASTVGVKVSSFESVDVDADVEGVADGVEEGSDEGSDEGVEDGVG